MNLTLKIWRQANGGVKGRMVNYTISNVSPDMSFLEMMDMHNEQLIARGEDPVAFDHDCREGICGMCSLFINGEAHGPDRLVTTCQLHMRKFNDGDTIVIEPFRANAYTQKTKSGSNLVKNKFLEAVLEEHGKNDDDTWRTIITNKGSCQHLDFLTQWEKDTFKTAVEINQGWVIEHASGRQPMICQSQSVNLFFPPDVNKGELHNVHMVAWAKNLKTLYYLRSEAISRADNVSSVAKREIIFENQDCLSCEG